MESARVFVDVELAPLPPHVAPAAVVADTAMLQSLQAGLRQAPQGIWQHLQAPAPARQHIAILAGPGYGKTTLFRHIALMLATHQERLARKIPHTLPILLFLRDCAAQGVVKPQAELSLAALDLELSAASPGADSHPASSPNASLDLTLPQAIADHLNACGGPVPPSTWFARQLQRGRCLIMLDGLDEVTDPDARRQIAAWIEKQIAIYPRNRFLISTRPYGYAQNPLSQVLILGVMPFGLAQIQQFVHNWYRANNSLDTQTDAPANHAAAQAQDLLQRLWETPALYKLATNPLLLTLIVHVHHYRGVLPKRRVDLYAEAYGVLLNTRQDATQRSPVVKQQVLQALAYSMMSEHLYEITPEQAQAVIAPLLARFQVTLSGAAFLKTLENVSGLVWEREHHTYSFAHQTFQEYLAAVHIRDAHLLESLLAQVEDPWWHETIRLYCAQADATPILQTCLADEHLSDLTFRLAMQCLDEAATVSPEAQSAIESKLYRCLDDARLLDIVTRALAEIRQERLTLVMADQWVDSRLITHAEYQLFLQARAAAGQFYHPDHWVQRRFPPGGAIQPVVGVRPSDAVAFCQWLDEQERIPVWRHRLPTLAEVQQGKALGQTGQRGPLCRQT